MRPRAWLADAIDRLAAYRPQGTMARTDADREPSADVGSAWERRGLVVTADGPLHLDFVAGSIG